VKEGKQNSDVTETIQKIATEFGVVPVEGMMSHSQERNVIDSPLSIILNPNEKQKNYERCTFAHGQVWGIDVLVTTGDGKPKESSLRTTIFKKTTTTYQLKMKASRATYSEITTKFGMFPFSIRSMEDEKKARMGIQECSKHAVVIPYSIFEDKEGEFVAQYMFTTMLTQWGPQRITQSFYDPEIVQSDKELKDPELVKLLNAGAGGKRKLRKKKDAETKEAVEAKAE